jgi:hypothetical protein
LLLNQRVVSDWDSVSSNLSETSLVDEVLDGLEVWITIDNVWLDQAKHVDGGSSNLDEDSVVDLSESQQLEDLSWLRGDLVDTSDTNNKSNLGLWWNVEAANSLGLSSESNEILLLLSVFTDVLFSSLEGKSS